MARTLPQSLRQETLGRLRGPIEHMFGPQYQLAGQIIATSTCTIKAFSRSTDRTGTGKSQIDKCHSAVSTG